MDVLECNQRFMRIEEDLRLFPDTRTAETGWWDVVRHDVMKHVYNRASGIQPDVAPPPKISTRLRNLAARLLLRAKLEVQMRVCRHEVLVFRAPRLLRNGQRVDTGLDQVLSVCPGRKLIVNTFPYRYDRRHARATELAPRPAGLDELENRIRVEFDIDVDLDHFIRQRLADFDLGLKRYAEMIARVRPGLVLINQNGIEKALFRAARKSGVPSVEVQHGLINASHPAYAYPESVSGAGSGAMFPDVMLTFSRFWIDGCHYPAKYRIPVGNDNFYPAQMPASPEDGTVLVISAPKYHDALVRWMRLVAPEASARRFVYKLHPSQSASLGSITNELSDLPNVTVRGTDVSVQALIAESSDVLLIQSTVAYEAVQAGRRLLIIPEFDYNSHNDLFELDSVQLVKDTASLAEALGRPSVSAVRTIFFEPFDAARTTKLLTLLLNTGQPFPPQKPAISSSR